MIRTFNDKQLQGTLTVKEVRNILNKYHVPYNEFAMRAMVKQAKQHHVKWFLHKCRVYTVAFFKALWYCITQKAHCVGKYAKGGVKRGRKDV